MGLNRGEKGGRKKSGFVEKKMAVSQKRQLGFLFLRRLREKAGEDIVLRVLRK